VTVETESRRWTRQRWLGTVAGVLAVQVAAVALLVQPTPPSPARAAFATRVSLVTSTEPGSRYDRLSLIDPALLALPSLHGFSGSAWLRYPSLEPDPADRALPPEWLGLSSGSLGGELTRYLSTNTITPPLLVDAPLPPVLRYENSFVREPVSPVSRLRVNGELDGRAILSAIDLPSWTHTEIISNTVIRAVVDAAGQTFSAAVLSRSGLPAADAYALSFLEHARFAPRAGNGAGSVRQETLSWGNFVFYWHTLPLPVTNPPPVLP